MKYPRFVPQHAIAPALPGPLRYGNEGTDLHILWAEEHTALSGAEVDYWRLMEHGLQRHPLYGEARKGKRAFQGPFRFRAHVDLPDAMPEVTEKGFRASWVGSGWISRAIWETATNGVAAPSEGDILGLWLRVGFYSENEAQQGDTVHGSHFYFTISNVSDAGHLFEGSEYVGYSVQLLRNTAFAPERRIGVQVP